MFFVGSTLKMSLQKELKKVKKEFMWINVLHCVEGLPTPKWLCQISQDGFKRAESKVLFTVDSLAASG